MPTISGPWAADALIHIKALIVHNIIIYTVYFVYTVLLGLFSKSLILVKYFISSMIDVIMPRNNHDSVEVLTFLKKRGFMILHTQNIFYMWESTTKNKRIFIRPTNFTTLKIYKKFFFFQIYIKIYCFMRHGRVCQNSYQLTPWIYNSPDGSSIVAGNIMKKSCQGLSPSLGLLISLQRRKEL